MVYIVKQGNTASCIMCALLFKETSIFGKEAEGCSDDLEAINCPGPVITTTSQLWNWCQKKHEKQVHVKLHNGEGILLKDCSLCETHTRERHPCTTAVHCWPTLEQGRPSGTVAHEGPLPEWVCSLWRAGCNMETHECLQLTIICTSQKQRTKV